jgi:RHH-type rel operon transcriptional repressor/antitoxin RelB
MALSGRLELETEKKLERLAKKTGRTKTWCLRQAVKEYMAEWDDYHIAVSRLREGKPAIPKVLKIST